MNYRRFKKLLISLALMCVFALPVAMTATPPVYAQNGVYSDVAQWRRHHRYWGYPGYRGYYGYPRYYYGYPSYGGFYRSGWYNPYYYNYAPYYRGYYGYPNYYPRYYRGYRRGVWY